MGITEFDKRLQHFPTLYERQTHKIAVVIAEKIEYEISNPTRLAGEVLDQIEHWSSVIIERDDFAIDDGSIRESAQALNNVRKSLVQDFPIPRIERDRIAGFHCDRPISVELDLFCGVERYAVLTLIGEPEMCNFAENAT